MRIGKDSPPMVLTNAKGPGSSTRRKRPPTRCQHLGEPTGDVFPPKDGAGDIAERLFSAVGVTKERWAATVAAWHGEPDAEADCSGCERRQRRWNYFGRMLGIGKKSAELGMLLAIEDGRHVPLYQCAVHGACLTLRSTHAVDGAPMTCGRCKAEGLGFAAVDPG